MDIVKGKWKKNVILKIQSMSKSNKKGASPSANTTKTYQSITESTQEDKRKMKSQVAPEGCFSVYVGPQRERFVIKTEFVNHPSFKMLLEDAALVYGYNSEGPILLPCEVDLFMDVLAEIADSSNENSPGCSFVKGYAGSFSLLSPSRPPFSGGEMVKGYGSFSPLSPSRYFRMNHL